MYRHLSPRLLLVSVCLLLSLGVSASAQEIRVPLSFEPNVGQTDSQVQFLSHGKGYSFFLAERSAVLRLGDDTFRLKATGESSVAPLVGEQPLPGKVNYLRGSDTTQWKHGVPTYARVRMADVAPRIDLVYYGNQRQLEYDFVVHPGGDPKQVGLNVEGAHLELTAEGGLRMRGQNSTLEWHRPVAYQVVDGRRQEVAAKYEIEGAKIRFNVGTYDPSRDLVVDPVLIYSTYVGGNGGDMGDVGNAIAADAAGSAYVVGMAASTNFPVSSNAAQTSTHGNDDAFVAKLTPDGTAYVYSTYLGGGGQDMAWGIAVDASGAAYVTGQTGSGLYGQSAFPTTAGAYQRAQNANVLNNSVFVSKISPDGSDLIYSTLLSGANDSFPTGIAVDASGNAYVLTNTGPGFPVTAGAYQRTAGTHDCAIEQFADGQAQVVTKLNATGSALVYSTYVGHGCDYGAAIAVNGSGQAFITGHTQDSAYPVTSGAAQPKFGGVVDGFVTKLNATGSGLLYSTFLGGSMADFSNGIAVDSTGYAYVAGGTDGGFPTTSGAYQPSAGNNGYRKGFITKVSPLGKALVYSTYVRGATNVSFSSIAVNKSHNAHVTGYTDGSQYPVTSNAVQGTCHATTYGCLTQAVVTKLNATGNGLLYSSYFGASDANNNYFPGNIGNAIAVDGNGGFYVTGRTSAGLKTTSNSAEPTYRSNTDSTDAFVAKFNTYGSNASTTKVTILSPFDGTATTKQVLVSAMAASTSSQVKYLQVYIDGALKGQVAANVITQSFSVSSGKHRISVQAIDRDSTIAKSTVYVTAQ